MKNEIMNGVQGLPGTAEANTESSRENAQKVAKWGFHFCDTIVQNHSFPGRFLPQRNAKNAEIRAYVVFLCDLCDLSWQFIFGCGVNRAGPFAPFRGHSFGANSPGRLGFQAGSPRRLVPPQPGDGGSRFGEGGSNPVKVSQTDVAGQTLEQIYANTLS